MLEEPKRPGRKALFTGVYKQNPLTEESVEIITAVEKEKGLSEALEEIISNPQSRFIFPDNLDTSQQELAVFINAALSALRDAADEEQQAARETSELLVAQAEKQEKTIAALHADLENQQHIARSLTEELNEIVTTGPDVWKEEKELIKAEIQRKNEEIIRFTEQLSALSEEAASLRSEAAEMRKGAADAPKPEAYAHLCQQFEELTHRHKELTHRHKNLTAQYTAEIAQREADLSQKDAGIIHLREEMATLRKEVADAPEPEAYAHLCQQFEELTHRHEELTHRHKDLTAQYTAEIAQREADLSQKDADIIHLREEMTTLRKETEEAKKSDTDGVELQKRFKQLTTRNANLTAEYEARIRRSGEETTALKEKVRAAELAKNSAENKVARLNLQVSGLEAGQRGLQNQATALKDAATAAALKDDKTARALRQKEQEIHALVMNNPIPVLCADRSLKIIGANPAYEQLSGMKLAELRKMNLRDFSLINQKGEGIGKTVKHKVQSSAEIEVCLPAGTYVLEQYGIPILQENGSVESVYIFYNDVTKERREAAHIRERMAENEILKKRSDLMIEENPMPILYMDTNFTIQVTNEAYVRMSGIPRKKLIGMNARDFNISNQEGDGLGQVIRRKKKCYGVVTVDLPSGTHVLEQYGIPIIGRDRVLSHLFIVYHDISDVREKEANISHMMTQREEEAKTLTESTDYLNSRMEEFASGNLTAEATIFDKDPLTSLKVHYNNSVAFIRSITGNVTETIETIRHTAKELTASSDEISNANGKMAADTQTITENMITLQKEIEAVSYEVANLSASIQEIASTSQEVMHQAQRSSEEGARGVEIGKNASEKMELVGAISQQSMQEITALNDQMKKIRKIVRIIADIADQTHLLAINAAIEAARAGEHGRGFSVVAGEIRHLAVESKEASASIEALIGTIQKESERTAESMRSADDEIRNGITSVNASIDAINTIVDGINLSSQGVMEITHATEDQANATNQLMEKVERVSQMARITLQNNKEMATLAEEVSASAEEVGSVVHDLDSMAGRLHSQIERFRFEQDR